MLATGCSARAGGSADEALLNQRSWYRRIALLRRIKVRLRDNLRRFSALSFLISCFSLKVSMELILGIRQEVEFNPSSRSTTILRRDQLRYV